MAPKKTLTKARTNKLALAKQLPTKSRVSGAVVKADNKLRNQVVQLESQLKTLKVNSTDSIVSKEAAKHAVRIIDPHDYSPLVLADEYSTLPVCPVVPFEITESDWQSSTEIEKQSDMQFAVLSRDPFASKIISTNNAEIVSSVQVYSGSSLVSGEFLSDYDNGNFGPLDYVVNPLNTVDPLHGNTLYGMKDDKGRVYYLCNVADQLELYLNATGTPSTLVTLTLYRYGERKIINKQTRGTDTSGILDSTISWDIDVLGYYSISIESAEPVNITNSSSNLHLKIASVTASNPSLWFGQHPIPDLNEKILSVDGLRVKGVSFLISNISNTLTMNGQITGYQLPFEENWWDPNLLTRNGLASKQGSETMNAKTGMYGWLKPTTATDFSFVNVLFDGEYTGNLNLACDKLMFAIYVQDSEQGSGRAFRFTQTVALDFKTGDTWFGLHQTAINAAVIGELRNMLAHFKQFHENPLHLKDVKEFFGKIIRGVVKYGPKVLETAVKVGKVALPLLAAI